MERLDKGGLPGCVEVCPAGAVIFGTREELMAEAKKRLALKPGSEYHYPRQTLKSGDTYLHTVPKYYPHLYGEKEGGGTQVLVLTVCLMKISTCRNWTIFLLVRVPNMSNTPCIKA